MAGPHKHKQPQPTLNVVRVQFVAPTRKPYPPSAKSRATHEEIIPYGCEKGRAYGVRINRHQARPCQRHKDNNTNHSAQLDTPRLACNGLPLPPQKKSQAFTKCCLTMPHKAKGRAKKTTQCAEKDAQRAKDTPRRFFCRVLF